MRQLTFTVLVLCFVSACTTTRHTPLESPLKQTGASWAEYYKSGDLDGLMTLYVDDAVVALHGQPKLVGVKAIREYFAPGIGKTDATFELEYELVEMHKDIAYAMAKYWLVSRAPGTDRIVYKDAGRSLLIYKKDTDGRWKIAVDIDQATPDVVFPAPG
ncbi:MAG: DUF4440 domain-containing protein [Pseudomonadota bacterium]